MQLRLSTEYQKRVSRVVRASQCLGFTNSRNLFWWHGNSQIQNFGDWIGPLLFEAITGKTPIYCPTRKLQAFSTTFYTVGSVLGTIKEPDRAIVWGSGIIHRDTSFKRPKEIHAVRGPISRERCRELGFSCPDVYGDPALLLPRYLERTKPEKKYAIGIIPHFVHFPVIASLLENSSDVKLIDVTMPVQSVVDDIVACERTISSSLHGIIVSHAYGVPSAWVKFSEPLYGDDVKFLDYFASASVEAPVPPNLREDELAISVIRSVAQQAILPDLSSLEERLIRACPFRDH